MVGALSRACRGEPAESTPDASLGNPVTHIQPQHPGQRFLDLLVEELDRNPQLLQLGKSPLRKRQTGQTDQDAVLSNPTLSRIANDAMNRVVGQVVREGEAWEKFMLVLEEGDDFSELSLGEGKANNISGSTQQKFKILLEKHSGYELDFANGRYSILGDTAEYQSSSSGYSQSLRDNIAFWINHQEEIPFDLVENEVFVEFDLFDTAKFDVGDFLNLSNDEFAAALMNHVFGERIYAYQNPPKNKNYKSYRDYVQFVNNGDYRDDKFYKKCHYFGGYPEEVQTINELLNLKYQYSPGTDIDLKTRQTTNTQEVCSGRAYDEVVYFYFGTFYKNGNDYYFVQITGSRKGHRSELSTNPSNDKIQR